MCYALIDVSCMCGKRGWVTAEDSCLEFSSSARVNRRGRTGCRYATVAGDAVPFTTDSELPLTWATRSYHHMTDRGEYC